MKILIRFFVFVILGLFFLGSFSFNLYITYIKSKGERFDIDNQEGGIYLVDVLFTISILIIEYIGKEISIRLIKKEKHKSYTNRDRKSISYVSLMSFSLTGMCTGFSFLYCLAACNF